MSSDDWDEWTSETRFDVVGRTPPVAASRPRGRFPVAGARWNDATGGWRFSVSTTPRRSAAVAHYLGEAIRVLCQR